MRALRLSFDGNDDGAAIARVWAAPWLSQLTRLDFDVRHGLVAGAVPRGGLDLPQLRELSLHGVLTQCSGLTPGQAAAVAACRLPRLEALGLRHPAPGSIAVLMVAPWAAGLSRVELLGDVEAAWCDAQAAAALARASSLTSLKLEFTGATRLGREPVRQPGLDGPRLAALLAAPWRTSLQRLELNGQPLGGSPAGDAARAALAVAALPALRALCLKNTGVTLAGLAELAGSPWARGLVAFEATGMEMHPPRPAAADSWWQLGPVMDGGLERAFAGVALPSLRSLSFEFCALLTADALLWFCRRTPWLSQLESLTIRGIAATPLDLEALARPWRACSGAELQPRRWALRRGKSWRPVTLAVFFILAQLRAASTVRAQPHPLLPGCSTAPRRPPGATAPLRRASDHVLFTLCQIEKQLCVLAAAPLPPQLQRSSQPRLSPRNNRLPARGPLLRTTRRAKAAPQMAAPAPSSVPPAPAWRWGPRAAAALASWGNLARGQFEDRGRTAVSGQLSHKPPAYAWSEGWRHCRSPPPPPATG
jgi:hypothetical protein